MDDFGKILEDLSEEGRLRHIPHHRETAEGLYDLCSNDYMGMARRSGEWREEFRSRFGNEAMTASASRLLACDQNAFVRLEDYLADLYSSPALLFNSGYHANVGIISALSIPGTLWVVDRLIHASAIDGLRLGGADFKRWRHNDTSHLRRILENEKGKHKRVVVMCESVYSMDGDTSPLTEICELKREYPEMMIYVDEAHAIGVYGHKGAGLADELGLLDRIDITVGTLGKACASVGAFAITSEELRTYLVNSARSLIFSTAIAPANAAWSLLMLEKLAGMDEERMHLRSISEKFRRGIERITGKPNPSRSAIVPLITGDPEQAVDISRSLEDEGVLALPIRRPTVPPGGERIRFSLNASLTEADIDLLLYKIEKALKTSRGTKRQTATNSLLRIKK